jgi:plastocyanin
MALDRRRPVTGLIALALMLVSCTSAGAGASPVATDRVELPPSYRFQPEAITVRVGTTVTWTNGDNFSHSVQFDGEAAPGMVMRPGEAATRTFDRTGTFAYLCTFHPQDMTGTVTVTG